MRVTLKQFSVVGALLASGCAPQYYGGTSDYTPAPDMSSAPVAPGTNAAPPLVLVAPPSFDQQQPDDDQRPPEPPPGYYAPPGGYYGQGGSPNVSYPVRVPAGSPLPDGKICGKLLTGCVYNQQQPGYYVPPPGGDYGRRDGYYQAPSYPVRVPAGSPLPNGKICGKLLTGCVYNSPYPNQ